MDNLLAIMNLFTDSFFTISYIFNKYYIKFKLFIIFKNKKMSSPSPAKVDKPPAQQVEPPK